MQLLDIGAVARQSGVAPSALRYYEQAGLITSVTRHGLRRQFLPAVLLQLKLIEMGKMAGFSLREIAGMFGKSGLPDLPRVSLRQRADEIDRQIQELTALRDTIRHVADCRAPSHLECPTFRHLLNKVQPGGAKRRKATSSFLSGNPNDASVAGDATPPPNPAPKRRRCHFRERTTG